MSQREPWLTSAVGELRPIFEAHNFPLPEKIRVTCGFPSKFARAINRAMGEWHPPSSSADGHHEIFISPVESDPWSVLAHWCMNSVTLLRLTMVTVVLSPPLPRRCT